VGGLYANWGAGAQIRGVVPPLQVPVEWIAILLRTKARFRAMGLGQRSREVCGSAEFQDWPSQRQWPFVISGFARHSETTNLYRFLDFAGRTAFLAARLTAVGFKVFSTP
jgi:hypothetical protein